MGVPVRLTLRALADALGAVLEGDPDVVVIGVAPLEGAGPEHVSFLASSRSLAAARASRAGAFLVGEDSPALQAPVLRARSPRLALIRLLRLFHPDEPLRPGVHPTAAIAAGASVDPSASVGAFVVVESDAVIAARVRLCPFVYVGRGAEVGEESILYPHAVVLDRVQIGRRVTVHAGAVLGADGFGYASDAGVHRKIPQVGRVVIGDDVEVGANTTIDRATMGDTVVGRGTKIDNLVQIAHNVEVGPDSIIAAQTGIAGSSRLGRAAMLGGQVGIADHVRVCDGVVVAAQSAVISDIDRAGAYLGTPARPLVEGRRIWAAKVKLPEMVRRLRAIERRIEAVERDVARAAPGAPEAR